MSSYNLSTLFSGFGGVELGYQMAGYEAVQGFEWDDRIAEAARANGLHIKTQDVLKLDPKKLEATYALHASPVCTNVSVANSQGKEEQLDIDAASKVAEFIKTWTPTKAFSLENVMPYQHTKSFLIILNALDEAGYKYRFFNMPFANYGVPQTRERLILLAHKDFRPEIPTPTHTKHPDNLFMAQWVGWYEAIEDLIPSLPESSFAPWQLKRLHEVDFFADALFPSANSKARTFSVRKSDDPAQTQTIGESKAFFISGDNARTEYPIPKFTPVHTIRAAASPSRAFILDGQDSKTNPRLQCEQVHTVTSSQFKGYQSAFISGAGTRSNPRPQDEPCETVTSGRNQYPRVQAWLEHGKVVKMTPRANARFQTFPDSYILPEQKSLAQKGIGNAVPPLGAFHFSKELKK